VNSSVFGFFIGFFIAFTLPYKCHCEAFFAEAISCFMGYFNSKEIATLPKSKSGGSQ